MLFCFPYSFNPSPNSRYSVGRAIDLSRPVASVRYGRLAACGTDTARCSASQIVAACYATYPGLTQPLRLIYMRIFS